MVFTQTKARKENWEENALRKTVARAPNTWTRQSADKRSLYLARSCGGNYYYYSIGFSFILDYLIVRHCGRLEKNRCYPKCYIICGKLQRKAKNMMGNKIGICVWWCGLPSAMSRSPMRSPRPARASCHRGYPFIARGPDIYATATQWWWSKWCTRNIPASTQSIRD